MGYTMRYIQFIGVLKKRIRKYNLNPVSVYIQIVNNSNQTDMEVESIDYVVEKNSIVLLVRDRN